MRFSSIVTGFLKHKDAYFKYHRFWVHDAIVHTFYHPSGKRAIKSEIQLHLMTGNKEIPAWLWLQVRKSVYEGPLKSPHILRNVSENRSDAYDPVNFPLAVQSLILSAAALPLWRHSEALCCINFLQTELQLVQQNKQKPYSASQTSYFSYFPFFFPLFWNIDNHIYVSPICVVTSCWQKAFFFFSHKRPDKEYVLPRPGL